MRPCGGITQSDVRTAIANNQQHSFSGQNVM